LKFLITGASGLLGHKLAELAIDAGHDVTCVYNEHPTTRGNGVQVDLRNPGAIRKVLIKSAPDVVVHTASVTDVDLCERRPQLAMEVNGEVTGLIARICDELNSSLVYVSSDYVFDGQRGHYVESDEPNPVNTYGRSKLLGEEKVSNFAGNYCTVRTSVLFGSGRDYRPNLATWLLAQLSSGKSVNVINSQYASPTLNSHLAKMLLEVAERRITGIIHLAGADRLNRYEFAVRLAREFGFDVGLLIPGAQNTINWYAKRPADSSISIEKGTRLLNTKPITVDDELRAFRVELQK